ncbi:MAG: hypothetical protein Ta2E_03240 [Mycoplasmoidaceae bacterium]|nr:MAG: hypothetical protein Ta2E_03240 [Mycoplasmoidaceae bacterium]
MMNQSEKKIQKIEVVDFNKLPNVTKYAMDKPKNNDLKNLGLIFLFLLITIGIGVGTFLLINMGVSN